MSHLIPELLHVVGAIALRSHGLSRMHDTPIEARALWFAALLIGVDLISESLSQRRDARRNRVHRTSAR